MRRSHIVLPVSFCLVMGLVAGVFTTPAGGAILYEEDFDALTPGTVDGQGGWTWDNYTGDIQVVAGGLSYNAGGVAISGGTQSGVSTSTGANLNFMHAIPFPAQTHYFRMLVDVDNQTGGNGEMFMRLDQTSLWNTYFAVKGNTPTQGLETRIGGGLRPVEAEATIPGINLLVGKLTDGGGGQYNKIEGWLNPAVGDAASPDSVKTDGTMLHSDYAIALYLNRADVNIDEILFATTWEEVVPRPAEPPPPDMIPEPATMALCGVGMAGLAGYVRRRKRGA